jgi:transglutaminase/protease-like cytokinesis protein 3
MNGNTSPSTRHASLLAGVLSLGLIGAVIACTEMFSSDLEQYDESAVEDMVLLPAEIFLGIGQTVQLHVTFLNARGDTVPGQVDSWTSSDPGVANVDGEGSVTAVSFGTTEITASATKGNGRGRESAPGQLKKKTRVIVSPDTVASVEVIPTSGSLPVGAALQLEAVVRDADGDVLQGRLVTWSSSNNQVATVDANGNVTGAGPGSAVITATSEGKQGTAAVEVQEVVREILKIAIWPSDVTVEAGQQVQFYVAALWSDGENVCDSSGASRDTGVLFNLTDYPAACDSAIARLSP